MVFAQYAPLVQCIKSMLPLCPILCVVLQKVNEVIMFGGEFTELETGKVRVYNDLYRFNTDKQKWSRVTSPNR